MGKLKPYLSIIALIALLLAAPGSIQGREEGCRAHTNVSRTKSLAPEEGSDLTGDYTWITFDSTDGLVSNSVGNIAVDHAGHLWLGTDGGGVFSHARLRARSPARQGELPGSTDGFQRYAADRRL